MILVLVLAVPLAGGLCAWVSGYLNDRWPRRIALAALAADLVLAAYLWLAQPGTMKGSEVAWIAEFNVPWIPDLGAGFHLAADGLSVVLVGLTAFLGCMAVLSSWAEVRERPGFFYLCLTWVLAGIFGVFLALDLFLFYFAWELMLVPMYFLISLWGHEDRFAAAVKFFIFTQFSGLLMLAAILGLYFSHGRDTGVYTFSYPLLVSAAVDRSAAMPMLLCFLAAFLVKLPAVPFHTWLPDAHTQAPTAGSVILAGLLLKTGAYGILRFAVPLFPGSAQELAFPLMVIGVIGILYGSLLAFAQSDLKRLVAYTSVSHMGFVLLGLFAGDDLAFKGTVVQMVCHGLSTGALFMLAGMIQERTGTRDLARMGGLWVRAPRMGGAAMFFALASLGLPGIGNFVGEFMVVLGAYRENAPLACVAALGFVFSTAYSLALMQRVFFGENREGWRIPDLTPREMGSVWLIIVCLLWLGLYPQPLIDKVGRAFTVKKTSMPHEVRGTSPGISSLWRGG